MRNKLMLCLLAVLASLLTADTLHGPGPFDPNDWYYYWNIEWSAFPQPPATVGTLDNGNPNQPYHCYGTMVGIAGPPNGFQIDCTSVAFAYITRRQDAAGGTVIGACTLAVDDWVYTDDEDAFYNEIDGGVQMSVPSIEGELYQDVQKCTATDGCTTVSNGGPRSQDCTA